VLTVGQTGARPAAPDLFEPLVVFALGTSLLTASFAEQVMAQQQLLGPRSSSCTLPAAMCAGGYMMDAECGVAFRLVLHRPASCGGAPHNPTRRGVAYERRQSQLHSARSSTSSAVCISDRRTACI
jgi:hypothetical protein